MWSWTTMNEIQHWSLACVMSIFVSCFLGFLSVIFIFVSSCVILRFWSLWVEGTCSKRSVAQIEACAAKAEREWKEWEKETEIPKNEKTYQKNIEKTYTNTIHGKIMQPGSLKWWMTESGICLVSTETQELRTARSEDAMSNGCPVSGEVPKIAP